MKPQHSIFFVLAALPLATAGVITAPSSAKAGCYENVGCTDRDRFTDFNLFHLSCQNLDFLRNSIFADKGYCFAKPKYRSMFEGRPCRFQDAGNVPLTRIERANVSSILRVEKEKGCRK